MAGLFPAQLKIPNYLNYYERLEVYFLFGWVSL